MYFGLRRRGPETGDVFNGASVSQQTRPQLWPIFICYRQVDGLAAARRLHEVLDKQQVRGRKGELIELDVYLDQTMPAVADWREIHRPYLEKAKALIVICTPGTKVIDGPDDWVHKEINWWLNHRPTVPILIDPLGQGIRYVPTAIRQRWKDDVQRIPLIESEWKGLLPAELMRKANDLRRQIVGNILPSGAEIYAKELEFERKRVRNLRRAVGVAMILLLAAGAATSYALGKRDEANLERDRSRIRSLAAQARRAALGDTPLEIQRAGALAIESVELARKTRLPIEADAFEAVLSAATGLPLKSFSHGGPALGLAVLPNGHIASAGLGGDITLWPLDDTRASITIPDTSGEILTVLTDGQLITAVNEEIKLWPKDGKAQSTVLAQGSKVTALAAMANGGFVSGGYDGSITRWSKDRSKEPIILQHGSEVHALLQLGAGQLVSGGANGLIKVWDDSSKGRTKEGGKVGEPITFRHGGSVFTVIELSDGRLASGGDGTIKIWPRNGTDEIATLYHGTRVLSLIELDAGRLASGGDDGLIKFWSKDGKREVTSLRHGSGPVTSLVRLPDGTFASAGDNGLIKLWPKDGTEERTILHHASDISSVLALEDGRLVSADHEGLIKFWPKDGKGQPSVLQHGGEVYLLAALPDGRVASSGGGGLIKVWSRDGERELFRFRHDGEVSALVGLSDGRLASGGDNGSIKLWPKDGKGEVTSLGHGSAVSRLVALPGGRLASNSEADGVIRLWSKDGIPEPISPNHGGQIGFLVAFSDGKLASSSGEDGLIKVWRRDGSGEPLQRQHGILDETAIPRGEIVLAVLSDGRLASGGEDGRVNIWSNSATEEPIVLRHGQPISSLVALPDGRLGSRAGSEIKLWSTDLEAVIAALCLRAGRNLTQDEWQHYVGSDTPRQPSCRNRPSNWRDRDQAQ
jgi:WD40 repeat protein